MMNFDYIELLYTIGTETIFFENLVSSGQFNNNTRCYQLNSGQYPIRITHNAITNTLRIKANFAYYKQGHNLNFSYKQLVDCISEVSELLNCNLLESKVVNFEFQSVLTTSIKTSEILRNHVAFGNFPFVQYNRKSLGLTGKVHSDEYFDFKLYDVVKNFKQKIDYSNRTQIFKDNNVSSKSNLIKVEVRYKNPLKHFGIENLSLGDLLGEKFVLKCQQDLMNQYRKITITGRCYINAPKGSINSATIPLILLLERMGMSSEDIINAVQSHLTLYPLETITKHDKSARMRQLRKNLKQISSLDSSKYDLTTQLQEAAKEPNTPFNYIDNKQKNNTF